VTDAPSVRPSGGWRRPGPWLLAGLVLAGIALPGGLAQAHLVRSAPTVGYGRPLATGPTTFSVSLTDAPSYTPRLLNATVSGAVTITVNLANSGSLDHTFTLVNLSQSGVILNRSWTPQELDQYFVANGTLANVNLSAHGTGVATISFPAPTTFESFEFVSTIPYQFQDGMWGFLNLTPVGPTLALEENTTTALQFVPNVLSAGPGITGAVTFDVRVINLGSLSHTFTVEAQSNHTLTSVGWFKTHAPLVNKTVPAVAGGAVWANFTVPGVGVYEYACTIAGHFQAGMYGFLYVGVPVPPAPPTPSTAIVAVPVLIGSGVLLGIGCVLALGSAYIGRLPRGGGPPEPPHA